jgi:hypothetical protein
MNITQSDWDTEKRHLNGCMKLYVDNNTLTERIDQWFGENNIGDMQVKSSAWALVSGTALGLIEQKIAKHFGIDPKFVKYSRKCGCRCGCSPGYNVRLPAGHPQANHNAWADVSMDIDGLDQACVENIINTRAPKKLAKDKLKEVDKLAAREAAKQNV